MIVGYGRYGDAAQGFAKALLGAARRIIASGYPDNLRTVAQMLAAKVGDWPGVPSATKAAAITEMANAVLIDPATIIKGAQALGLRGYRGFGGYGDATVDAILNDLNPATAINALMGKDPTVMAEQAQAAVAQSQAAAALAAQQAGDKMKTEDLLIYIGGGVGVLALISAAIIGVAKSKRPKQRVVTYKGRRVRR